MEQFNFGVHCVSKDYNCYNEVKVKSFKSLFGDVRNYKIPSSDTIHNMACTNKVDTKGKICILKDDPNMKKQFTIGGMYYKLVKDTFGNIEEVHYLHSPTNGYKKVNTFGEFFKYIWLAGTKIDEFEKLKGPGSIPNGIEIGNNNIVIIKDVEKYIMSECPTKDCKDLTVLDKYPKEIAGGTGLSLFLCCCCCCCFFILLILLSAGGTSEE
jgi:hypothetical protein